MTIITPNPADDVVVNGEIVRLGSRMHDILKKYKGQTPTTNELRASEQELKKVINNSLFIIGNRSLEQGCKEVNVQVKPELEIKLRQHCIQRAEFSAHSIIVTTGQAIGVMYAALSKKHAVGKKRSKSNAKYEGNRIFHEQRMAGWKQRYGTRKRWYGMSEAVCDLCQDNEDDDAIEIDEAFSSGDFSPPGHYGCECLMSLIY